jgi:hypothetical protein
MSPDDPVIELVSTATPPAKALIRQLPNKLTYKVHAYLGHHLLIFGYT